MANCVYLIGMGAAKAGTTLLYDLLRKHPEVCVGEEKEMFYFCKEKNPTKVEYDALFSGSGVKLDVTPEYMYFKECPGKITRALGTDKVKMVVLLRDPIERARSHYNMRKYQKQDKTTFEESFRLEKERTSENERIRRQYGYFKRGLYSNQLDNLYSVVPKENVLVLLFEDFIKDQQKYIDIVCDFAGLGRISVKKKHSNMGVSTLRFKFLDTIIRTLCVKTPKKLKFKSLRAIKHFIVRHLGIPANRTALDERMLSKLKDYYTQDVARLKSVYGIETEKWRNFC